VKAVIAGNYQEYLDYLRENNLSLKEARYASQSGDLLGFRETEIIRTGKWWLNPLSKEGDFNE